MKREIGSIRLNFFDDGSVVECWGRNRYEHVDLEDAIEGLPLTAENIREDWEALLAEKAEAEAKADAEEYTAISWRKGRVSG